MDIRDSLRVGFGYDSHRFSPERKLFLCGIEIEGFPGLLGHSDGDVCLHSIMDALLSTTNLGDIGENFPSEDESLKGISSEFLLKKTMEKILKNYPEFEILN
ncbi:MAG: 2-C-methyl-D-erythritol 2,4-cyclodiphosphate synthase, partial [Thermoanaerobaculia bacterium]